MRDASHPLPHGRFAPSPTGPLHAGSLVAALGSWLLARQRGGSWQVRIEDVDRLREVPGASDAQLQALRAFGLCWDGDVVRQSERGGLYQDALDALLQRGDAFVCHCSRADLAATGGLHRGRCASAARRTDPAIRLRVPDGTRVTFDDAIRGRVTQDLAAEVGDFVLRRADGFWAYQLAVVVDDAAQGINEVVRGADLLDSTARQIHLQRRLQLPTPRYAHLPLLLDDAGRKLSKSAQAMPVDVDDPLPTLRQAWELLGQAPLPPVSDVDGFLCAARAAFDFRRIPGDDVTICASHNRPVRHDD